MKTSGDSGPDEALEDAATAWVCERDEGFTLERAKAFAEWRARDQRHLAAVIRVERALALIGEMRAVRAPLEARFGRAGETAVPAHGGRLTRFPVSILFAAAALVVGAVAWWSICSRAPADEHFATDASALRRVELRDGSVVDINTISDVRVEFSASERHVSLNAGEAHFQVTADAARPFVVTAGGVSVRAVGTAFNVRIATEAVEVIVMEGKVEVIWPRTRGTDSQIVCALLAAGEKAQVSRDVPTAELRVEQAAPETIRTALAWQDPMTTFNDVPLSKVVTRLNQRNAMQIVLEDAELGERKIGGVIALDQVEAFVRLLEQGGDVVAERRAADEIRLRRAR